MTGSTDAEDAAVVGEHDGRGDDEAEDGSGRIARALRGLGVGVAAVLFGVVLLVAALQIDRVSGFVARSAADLISGDSLRIRIGGASGSWIGGIRLTDLEMSGGAEADPAWSFSLDTLSADYRLISLLRGRPHVTRLDASGVTVGATLGGEDESDGGELPFPIRVDSAAVGIRSVALTRVGVDSEPWRLSDGRVRLHGLALSDDTSRVVLDTLTASFRPPGRPEGWGSIAVAGALEGDRVRIGRIDLRSPESEVDIRGTAPTSWAGTAPDGLDLDVSLAPLHLADIGPFLPGTVSDSLHLRGDGTLRTRGDTLLVRLDAEADVPGSVQVDAQVSGSRSSPDVGGIAEVSSLDLAAWGLSPRALVVNGSVRFDLSRVTGDSIHGTASIEAGIDERDGPLRGQGTVEAQADSAGAPWEADWTWSGMGLDAAGDAEFLLDGAPEWSVAADMAWDRPEAGTSADTSPQTEPEAGDARSTRLTLTTVAASLEASGRGFSPDSLVGSADLRLDSVVAADGTRAGPGRLSAEMTRGDASADLELTIGGGRLTLAAEGDVLARTGRITRGRVEGVDLAALLGDTVSSTLEAEFTAALESATPLDGSATARILTARYGARSLDSARVAADIRGERVDLRLSAALPDSGRLGVRGRLERGDTAAGVTTRLEVDSLSWTDLDLRALAGASAGDTSSVPSSALTGDGRASAALRNGSWTGSATLDLGPSRLGDARIEEGRIALERDPVETRAQVMLRSAQGDLDGRGSLRVEGPGVRVELADLRVDSLNLGAFGGGTLPTTSLTGSGTGDFTTLPQARAQGPPTPDTARADLLSRIRGRLTVDLGASRIATTAIDTASLTVAVDSAGTERIRADGRVVTRGWTLAFEGRGSTAGRPTYELTGSVDRTAESEGAAELLAQFEVEGHGTRPESMDARGWIQVDSARWAGRPLESGVVRAAIRDGVLTVDTMNLSLPGARLTGGGRLPVTDEAGDQGELHASLSLTRADVLAGAMGPEVLAVGEAGVDVTASGSLDDLTVQGDARITALLFGDIRIQGVEFTGTGRRTSEEGWVEGEAHLMVDRLRLPTAPVQRLDVDAVLEPDGEVALSASAVIDQRRDAELSARVDDMAAPGAVTLERFSFRADQDRWTLAEPTRVSVQDGFRVDSLRLSADGQTIRIAGELPTRGPLDFQADVEQFEIATVADLLGFPDLRGRVSGSLDVGGTAAAPVVESSLQSRLEPRGAPAADVSATLDYREGTATLDASAELDAGGTLRGSAELPMELSMSAPAPALTEDAAIRMQVRADSFPAQWFEPWVDASTMRNLEGRLDGEMRVTGTPADPSLDGSLTLRRGGVRFPALGTRYEGISAGLSLSGTRITVDSARVESGDGTLTGSGSIEVEELNRPEYDLRISADRFEVMNTSAVQTSVSGQVDLEGPLDAPRISGRIDVEGGDLYLGDLVEGTNVEDVRLSEEQWEELARVFGYERPGRGMRESPFMETATLDLDVRLGRASWLRQRSNPELAVQFTGEVSVEKQPGDPLRLAGTVEAVPDRSWVEQFGRRFSIEEGQLNFRGVPENTRIEATAQYEVPSRDNPGQPEVVISLSITGTPGDLQLELSSTPTLEASDMVSYLVTGRPASQALSGGGEGTLGGTGRALALGRLSSAVEAYAREEVGLDVVEITTTGLEGLTLLAGRYLSPDLYLGIRQPISLEGSSDEGSEQAPTPEVELEFQAIRWLLLNVRAGGRSGVEFFVRTRIAYE